MHKRMDGKRAGTLLVAAALLLSTSVAEGAGVPFVFDSDQFFDYQLSAGVDPNEPAVAPDPREAWETPPGWGGDYVGATFDAPSHSDFENWVDNVDLGVSQFSLWLLDDPGGDARAWGEELVANAVSAQAPDGWFFEIYDNPFDASDDFQGTGAPHQRITFFTGVDEPWHPYFISPNNSVGEFVVNLGDIHRWDGSEYQPYDPVIGDDYRFYISFDEVWMQGMTPNDLWLWENPESDIPHWMHGATDVAVVPTPAAAWGGLVLLGVLGGLRPARRSRRGTPTVA